MVPAVSILIGIPIVGEIPDGIQIGGLLLVTVGLLGAIGVLRRSTAVSGLTQPARTV
jgi:hypothetical protein